MDTTLSPLTVQIIASLIIPIITGLATKFTLSSGVKAVITIVLSSVSTLIIANTVDGGGAVITQAVFLQWIIGVIIALSTYGGFYKPLNLTSSTPDGLLAPNKGIGPSGPEV